MAGYRLTVFALVLVLAPAAAPAQPARAPTENVTVTGTRSRQVLQDFVRSFAKPTRLTGKIARWSDGICPFVAGLPPGFTKFVVRRLRDVAVQVGAPVNNSPSCKPNVEIAFTTSPQALIDKIRRANEGYLGYHDTRSQLDRLATVTRPIQAWYTTATQDLTGNTQVDGGKTAGPGMSITYQCPPPGLGLCTIYLPSGHAATVTGTRLGDGLRSALYHVIIVADPSRLKDYEMGALADYIAMLALAQMESLDACQPLPSIVNMLAQGCAAKADALTENDAAYLHGLYKMSADMNLGVQQDQLAYQMEQALAGPSRATH